MKVLKDQNGRIGSVTGSVNKWGQASCVYELSNIGIIVQPEDEKGITTVTDTTGSRIITASFWTLQESGEYLGRWYNSPAEDPISGRLIHLCLHCGKEITVPNKNLQNEYVNDAAYNFCDRDCMLSYEAACEIVDESNW